MQVILLLEVLDYLEELAVILYKKGYFSFEETSLNYVLGIYDDIVTNLPKKQHNLHQVITTNMEKVCFMHHLQKIDAQHGILNYCNFVL